MGLSCELTKQYGGSSSPFVGIGGREREDRKEREKGKSKMPLGKYYCDYCDKEFQDTPSARRRHLQGVLHQRSKAFWYDSFQDPNQVNTTGFGRGICNRFIRTGFCQYGDSCKYLHPNQHIQYTNSNQAILDNSQAPVIFGNQLVGGGGGGGSLPGNVARDSMGISWGNLPPSLKPPPEAGYPSLPFIDWG